MSPSPEMVLNNTPQCLTLSFNTPFRPAWNVKPTAQTTDSEVQFVLSFPSKYRLYSSPQRAEKINILDRLAWAKEFMKKIPHVIA